MDMGKVWAGILSTILIGICAGPALGLSVLLAPGLFPNIDVEPRLTALGHSVSVIDPATWDGSFDYSAYDVVAFQYGSGNPADIAHLVDMVDAEVVGVVIFRGAGSEATATALGLISSSNIDYQIAAPLTIVDVGHPITQYLELTTYSAGYGNMSYVVDPGVDTTTLATGPLGAAMVVHNTRHAVVTPYYGAYWESDYESAVGEAITDNCVVWAAGETVPLRKMAWGAVKSLFAD